MSNPSTYRLFLSPRSPFARRIRLALRRLKLPVEERFINVFEDHPDFLALNPLGMIPTLVTPEGMPLMDSSAILETLDEMTGSIWPRDRQLRVQVRNASTLITGMIQSMVSFFQESSMHEVPSPFWMQDHHDTIRRARERALQLPLWIFIQDQQLTQAGWDLAIAKEYLEFRVKDLAFPEDHSTLKEVLNLAMKDPAFQESKPKL